MTHLRCFVFVCFLFQDRTSLSMFSMIVTAIFSAYAITAGRGLEAEKMSAYKALVNCGQTAWDADVSDLRAKGGHANSAEKEEEACIFSRVRFTQVLQLLRYKTSRVKCFATFLGAPHLSQFLKSASRQSCPCRIVVKFKPFIGLGLNFSVIYTLLKSKFP